VNDVHAVLLQQQQKAALLGEINRDVKLMCTPPPAPYMQIMGPNIPFTNTYTLKSNKSYASGYSHQRKFTGMPLDRDFLIIFLGSRAALIGNDHYSSSNSSSNSANNSGSGATPLKFPHQPNFNPQQTAFEDYATLYDCVPDKYTLSTPTQAMYTCSERLEDDTCCSLSDDDLRRHDQQATIVAAQVDSECSKIELRKCGASVLLSESTFPQITMVFLAVSDDLQVNIKYGKTN
jgi:hypothetical protein